MSEEDPIRCEEGEPLYSGDEELDNQIINWLKWDQHKKTRKEVKKMIEKQDWATLRDRMLHRLTFGTAGLRGQMRAGFDSINELVMIQTAQGIAEYMLEQFMNGKDRMERGVVIGFDGRHNSKRYAQLIAAVFARKHFRVYLTGCLVATPFVPFAVLKYKALAGLMVTASHNPKEDNGLKVYWSNGVALNSPHSKNIQAKIVKHQEPEEEAWILDILNENPLVLNPYKDVLVDYYNALAANIPPLFLQANDCSQLRFVYTPVHGVGYRFVEHAFFVAKLNPPVVVPEQKDPNPNFPTVKVPDPNSYEGRAVFKMAIELADKENITTILANDPDVDRLVVAEKTRSGGWKIFNGNELGALLGYWSIETFKQLNPRADMSRCYLIASAVSSKFLRTMAIAEGMNFVETLSGFKWMANMALDLRRAGKTVLFAFEESMGYMFFTNVLDKDGISAAAHLATMTNFLRNERNQTLCEKLDELYRTYGYHCTRSSYFICNDSLVMQQIFARIRLWDNGHFNTYPMLFRKNYQVESVRDLTTGYDNSMPNAVPILPVSRATQMITFTFTNGAVITLRTSNTKPRIKYYAELLGEPEKTDWDAMCDTLDEMVEIVIEDLLKPKDNGLITIQPLKSVRK